MLELRRARLRELLRAVPTDIAPADLHRCGCHRQAAADLLARDDHELEARLQAVIAAEISAAAERARLDALVADANALQAQMNPTGGTT